jgi:hypothetical protein
MENIKKNLQFNKFFSKQNIIISGVVMAILSFMGYKLYDKGYLDDFIKNNDDNGKKNSR